MRPVIRFRGRRCACISKELFLVPRPTTWERSKWTCTYQDMAFSGHGFLRQADGTLISFDAPSGVNTDRVTTGATGINATGQISGYVYPATYAYESFLRQADGSFEVFFSLCFPSMGDRLTTSLALPMGLPTGLQPHEGMFATGMNDSGQITGVCAPGFSRFSQSFLWQPDGTLTIFSVPTSGVGEPSTRAQAINSRGQITGVYCCDTTTFNRHAFLREPDGTLTIFDTPSFNGQFTTPIPTAINAKGQITGYTCLTSFDWTCASDSGGADQGFLRQPDGSIAMFAVPNSISTQPAAINPKGEITGVYVDASNIYHGFLRGKDGTITTFDVANALNTNPTGINAEGDITGWYSDTSGVHGFVRNR